MGNPGEGLDQTVTLAAQQLLEAELRSHSAWRTDDETPPTTNRPETKNTTITQRPVESLLGLSEPKHLGIEKIEI